MMVSPLSSLVAVNYNNSYIRNRKTGTVRKVEADGSNSPLTTMLLKDLVHQFPESTFTGFRILENRGGWFIRQATGYDDKLQSQWKKEKSIALTNFGYHKYYTLYPPTVCKSLLTLRLRKTLPKLRSSLLSLSP